METAGHPCSPYSLKGSHLSEEVITLLLNCKSRQQPLFFLLVDRQIQQVGPWKYLSQAYKL
jgi:hypothetical protein